MNLKKLGYNLPIILISLHTTSESINYFRKYIIFNEIITNDKTKLKIIHCPKLSQENMIILDKNQYLYYRQLPTLSFIFRVVQLLQNSFLTRKLKKFLYLYIYTF